MIHFGLKGVKQWCANNDVHMDLAKTFKTCYYEVNRHTHSFWVDQIELLKEHIFTFTSAIITSNAKFNAVFVSVLIERWGAISHLADYRWASILHTPDSHPHEKHKCRVKYGASAYANPRNHQEFRVAISFHIVTQKSILLITPWSSWHFYNQHCIIIAFWWMWERCLITFYYKLFRIINHKKWVRPPLLCVSE